TSDLVLSANGKVLVGRTTPLTDEKNVVPNGVDFETARPLRKQVQNEVAQAIVRMQKADKKQPFRELSDIASELSYVTGVRAWPDTLILTWDASYDDRDLSAMVVIKRDDSKIRSAQFVDATVHLAYSEPQCTRDKGRSHILLACWSQV